MGLLNDDIHCRPESYDQHISRGIDDISEQSPQRDGFPKALTLESLSNAWKVMF